MIPSGEQISEWFEELGLVPPAGEDLDAMAHYAAYAPLSIETPGGVQTRDFR